MNDMTKLIRIQGNLREQGTTANKLQVLAAMKGQNLTEYIYDLLNIHVNEKSKTPDRR